MGKDRIPMRKLKMTFNCFVSEFIIFSVLDIREFKISILWTHKMKLLHCENNHGIILIS